MRHKLGRVNSGENPGQLKIRWWVQARYRKQKKKLGLHITIITGS
ncbi:MAG: hypothetical protein V3T89_02515 [bacterium]